MSSDIDKQTVDDTIEGWKFVMNQGALIAMFPIEEWLEAFDRAETVAPFTDPTLYREYIYSGKGEPIKDVLRAALKLKQAVLKARAAVTSGKVKP